MLDCLVFSYREERSYDCVHEMTVCIVPMEYDTGQGETLLRFCVKCMSILLSKHSKIWRTDASCSFILFFSIMSFDALNFSKTSLFIE